MSVANFTLSGKIVVQGNTVGGITKNTQLEPGTVIDASGLTADSKIGITYNGTIEGGTSVSITTANASDISGYFLLDDTSAGYEIQNGASNAVELVSKKPAFEQDGIVFDTEWNTDLSEDTVISQNENIVLKMCIRDS